ncbi:MAG TPA: hypothetical protein VND94_06770 [Terriglobia bacterium]|nr:hypothetical protein [Terriglobia bacterium]
MQTLGPHQLGETHQDQEQSGKQRNAQKDIGDVEIANEIRPLVEQRILDEHLLHHPGDNEIEILRMSDKRGDALAIGNDSLPQIRIEQRKCFVDLDGSGCDGGQIADADCFTRRVHQTYAAPEYIERSLQLFECGLVRMGAEGFRRPQCFQILRLDLGDDPGAGPIGMEKRVAFFIEAIDGSNRRGREKNRGGKKNQTDKLGSAQQPMYRLIGHETALSLPSDSVLLNRHGL